MERKQQRALITGATGFLGSHLCMRLLAEGAAVHALCRPGSTGVVKGVAVSEAALDDAAGVANVVRAVRPDYVFHLAAITSASRDRSMVLPTFQTNLVSTVNLLNAVAEVECRRVVLAGSLEEPESNAAAPSSPYAASKAAATTYARMFWELYKTPVTTARIFMVYGPGQRDTKKLIPFTILSLLRGEAPAVSAGTRLVDWVYIDDVVAGLISLSRSPGIEGQSIDIGSGELTSVRDVILSIAKAVGSKVQPAFGAVPERPAEQVRSADTARTAALTGWKPAVTLAEGLQRTVDFYREHKS